MSDTPSNQRAFQRYQTGFTVSVTLPQDKDNILETATVRDLSGGGLSFISQHVEHYAIDQQLVLHIHLPGAGTAPAHMQGTATVVRIDTLAGKYEHEAAINLRLDQPLTFDHKPPQSSDA